MRLKKIALFSAIISTMFTSVVWAKPRFSLVGDAIYSTPRGTGVTDGAAKIGYGGGLLVEFPLSPRFGLELGALYLMKKFQNAGSMVTANVVQAPLALRYWLSRVVSFGLGGYYSSGIGNLKSAADGTTTTQTYADAGYKKADFGALGSFGFNFPMGNTVSFLLDGRYTYGLADIDTAAGKDRFQDAQVLVGIRFGGKK